MSHTAPRFLADGRGETVRRPRALALPNPAVTLDEKEFELALEGS